MSKVFAELTNWDMEVLIKFAITAVLGLIIGLEREMKRKPVGLRTCLVISIVSCLLTIVSIESAYEFKNATTGVRIQMDPLRLAAQIVSGIGFLGAGVILRRDNNSISGLTTAAIIWGAAGIGIAVGAGFYLEAITGVILIMLSVEFIPFIMMHIGLQQLKEKDISIVLNVDDHSDLNHIQEFMKENKITVRHIRIRDLNEGGKQIRLKATVNFKRNIAELYEQVSSIEHVRQVEIES
mgnify:CR=1 FL=1